MPSSYSQGPRPLVCAPLFFLLLCFSACGQAERPPEPASAHLEHPFLIVKKDQFAALRAKSETEPWKSMKRDAIARSDAGMQMGNSNSGNAYALQDFVGAAALAYLLDADRAAIHAGRVRDAILEKYSLLDLNETSDWGGVVPNLGSYFVAILSLDIVYGALSKEEIGKCEESISSQIFKLKRNGSWSDVRLGTHGTWDIYTGVRTTPDDDYYEGIMWQITEDGVSPVTIHYAWERVGGGDSRLSKSGYMDVLEFTGIDKRYYQNERLQKFYRWLFGLSVNTSKEMAIIGDMLPTQTVNNDMLHRRVGNFDAEAAAYVAWFHEGVPAKGHILSYILPKQPLPPPKTPESDIYPNGGAFFREKPDDPKGLHAVLYNIMSQDEWHTHNEVNGLAFSGYGNRLLVNGGRLGAPTRPAPMNNTLTLDGKDHDARLGGGITEGFTADLLDYASGAAGPAWRGGQHARSLVLVHAADGAQAYALLWDEVTADAGSEVSSYFHPANESQVAVVAADEVYDAAIDHFPSAAGAHLAFFYATPPVAVTVEKVPSAVPERYPDYPWHNRLQARYLTGTAGHAHIATVLFPYNSDHPRAGFTRMSGSGFTGGALTQAGGVTDWVFASEGTIPVDDQGVFFQANGLWYRQVGGQARAYFVKKGSRFLHNGLGFEADAPLSLYFRENAGTVISPGANLTLRGAGLGSVTFDPPVTVLSSGADFIEVALPAGSYRFR